MKDLILSLFTLPNIAVAATAIVGLLGTIFGGSALRRRRIALATFHAFHIAQDIASETTGEDAFDKLSAALEAADRYMLANGWRPLKDGEKALVSVHVQSLSGQAKALAAGEATPSPR
jgi:hypothetical protein